MAKLDKEVQMIDIDEKSQSFGVSNVSTGNGFLNEMIHFADAIRNGSTFSPGIPEAFSSFAVAEAMMRSAETNKLIEL